MTPLQCLDMSHSDVYTALLTKQQTNMRMETCNSAHAAGITHYQLNLHRYSSQLTIRLQLTRG
jgi:hypothetical protein